MELRYIRTFALEINESSELVFRHSALKSEVRPSFTRSTIKSTIKLRLFGYWDKNIRNRLVN